MASTDLHCLFPLYLVLAMLGIFALDFCVAAEPFDSYQSCEGNSANLDEDQCQVWNKSLSLLSPSSLSLSPPSPSPSPLSPSLNKLNKHNFFSNNRGGSNSFKIRTDQIGLEASSLSILAILTMSSLATHNSGSQKCEHGSHIPSPLSSSDPFFDFGPVADMFSTKILRETFQQLFTFRTSKLCEFCGFRYFPSSTSSLSTTVGA